ncbi:MAG: hypothetical protein M1821_004125 [Bathelium mastoideum]|nr:MAG: hypothetical protein M1821_004125 [Bathelium mastoideum]KAI9691195.1 MAG: hypothetical protein M1822_008815 [Bathelium mastoideum]
MAGQRGFADKWSPKLCVNCCWTEEHESGHRHKEESRVKCLAFDGQDYLWAFGNHLLLRDKPFREGEASAVNEVQIIAEWKDGNRLLTLMGRTSELEPPASSSPSTCLTCGFTEDFKKLWKTENASIVALDWYGGLRYVWNIGSFLVLKERLRGAFDGGEESVINYVNEHTTIPVPNFVKIWKEDEWVFNLQERLPGVTLEQATADYLSKVTLSRNEIDDVHRQVSDCIVQLRKLQSPHPGTPNGQPLRDDVFSPLYREANWTLLPHDEYKREWYQRALTGVGESDREELDELFANFPESRPYTMTHVDFHASNILVLGDRLSGMIDWDQCGFGAVWWQLESGFHEELFLDRNREIWASWVYRFNKIYKPNFERSLQRWDRNRKVNNSEDTILPGPNPYPKGRCSAIKPGPIYLDLTGEPYTIEKLPHVTNIPDFDIAQFRVERFRELIQRRSQAGQSEKERWCLQNLITTHQEYLGAGEARNMPKSDEEKTTRRRKKQPEWRS